MSQIRSRVDGARLQRRSSQPGINVAVSRCAQSIPRLSEITAPEELYPSRLGLSNLRIPIVSSTLEAPPRAPIP